MPPDMQGIVREILTSALQSDGLTNALQGSGSKLSTSGKNGSNGGGLSGMKGLAAGAGAAALAPLAFKNAGKLARSLGVDGLGDAVKSPGEALEGAKSNIGDRLTSSVKDKAKGALDEAGGPGGIAKDAAKQMLPFGGGDGDGGGGKGGAEGVGKGRRMPVQQVVDIGIPVESVYNQFTQFEDWPEFMHRVKRATQEDDCTVSFAVKIWGKTKEFTAKIETQRPDQRIKWKSSQGMTHTGVVTFHELGPNLTRVILNFDLDPGGPLEKFARGARYVKRAARADLHRFVALIETAEHETGAWRGVIEDGEVVEEHDPGYDDQREYSDIEELTGQDDSDEDEDEDENEDEDEDENEDEDEHGDGRGEDEESPTATRSQRRQRSGNKDRQTSGRGQNAQRRQSAQSRQSRSSSRSSSSGSSRSQPRGGSSRRQSEGGSRSAGRSQARSPSSRQGSGSSSSRSGGRSRSSGGQSRGRSRPQSRNS